VRSRTIPIAAAVVAALVLAPAAAGHVTLNPPEWEAGGFARFAVRVPNERDAADTTRVTVKLPEQILSASFQPIEGWRRAVKMVQLDQPIDDEGEQITERIDTVTWSGGRIRPGEFQEFGVSFQVPEDEEPGSQLVFPSVQRYSNGEVVRWIGPEDAEEPAPTVTVLEPAPEEGAAAATPEPAPAQPAAGGEQDEEGGSDALSIVALIVAVAALAGALAALVRSRRRPAAPAPPEAAMR
jgi:uncharacterized protein YcnI